MNPKESRSRASISGVSVAASSAERRESPLEPWLQPDAPDRRVGRPRQGELERVAHDERELPATEPSPPCRVGEARGSVLVEVLADDHLQHRLVAEAPLRALASERVDQVGLKHDRGRGRAGTRTARPRRPHVLAEVAPLDSSSCASRVRRRATAGGLLLADFFCAAFRMEPPFVAPHRAAADRAQGLAAAGEDQRHLAAAPVVPSATQRDSSWTGSTTRPSR